MNIHFLGTGSNACYVERVKNSEMYDGPENGKEHVLINTEWGKNKLNCYLNGLFNLINFHSYLL